ncbi:TetR/AcrR family transcriptional regulator [Maridesulfovibrio sp. FT414]|uniref:TetR/AcrR family transcriptional regulator n=1 Tax=Maridesulfovibrio sp. FT414 TaxID=2979469 RepID=UPI003D801A40
MTKREIIFHAGTKLFAERSFNSVGIRDIAREAEVNSAMISYYFGGKTGLHKEIFSVFKDRVLNVVRKSMEESSDHFELVDRNVEEFLKDARENRNIYLVGLRVLNHDSPELEEIRDSLYSTGWKYFSEFLARTGARIDQSEDTRDITFTAVLGTIFSDYLLGGGTFIDDDSKIESYKKVVSGLLKYGSPALWA